MDAAVIAGPEPAIRREPDPVKRAQKLLGTNATGRDLIAALVASLEEHRARPAKLRADQKRRVQEYERRMRLVRQAAKRILSA